MCFSLQLKHASDSKAGKGAHGQAVEVVTEQGIVHQGEFQILLGSHHLGLSLLWHQHGMPHLQIMILVETLCC